MLDCSQIRDYLSREHYSADSRRILILAGDEAWQTDVMYKIIPGFESGSLWVGDKEISNTRLAESNTNKIPQTTFKHAHHWLGGEKQVVVFDATESFDVDAFAAISGIVTGGGVFIFLMPAREKWHDIYHSHFGQRLIQHLETTPEIILVTKKNKKIAFDYPGIKQAALEKCVPPYLTRDQQSAVEEIIKAVLNHSNIPLVVISDRGRGKSASLGFAAAKLIQSGINNIAITAPRMRATEIIFKHIAEQLPGAVVSRGCVKFENSSIQFYSPDQLLQTDINIDLLLVDEAATIPVPLLTSLLTKFPQCVFATTVHGYEGTGRGFSLRFNKILNQHKPGWLKLQLQTPIRWPGNDCLEKWMFDLLCLDAEVVDANSLGEIELEQLEHKVLTRDKLVKDEPLLSEVFALLVLAHYRTRPSDLKSLLDDTALSIYVTLQKKHVVAVALLIREGSFTGALSNLVYRGERRPPGHLLAQALTYHCGVENAATLDYSRVMRIAVHPELQQQGIGTQLLDYIVSCERSHGRDAIGTSFGMNKLLWDFWTQAGFDFVRIGFTREQTSGEHAAIMLLPLSHAGKQVNLEAARRFNSQVAYWFNDILQDLPAEIKQGFPPGNEESLSLTNDEIKDLQSFIHTSRNYELCIAALNKMILQKQGLINKHSFPEKFRLVLNHKIIHKSDWKKIAGSMGLDGKHQARALFKDAVIFLLDFDDRLS